MAVTPEGKIKKLVKAVLEDFGELTTVSSYSVRNLYEYWPVPSGFGASSLDCIVCYYGVFIAIETKAPGERTTPRQNLTIAQLSAAQAIVMVIDSEADCEVLHNRLMMIKLAHANNS